MDQLQAWMVEKSLTDADVAPLVGVSRVQMSRIRRGVTGASKSTALKLQEVTAIPWFEFIDPNAKAA